MAVERSLNDVNMIPLDLTVEILKKLPAKSIVRFLCVSKQWTSIIRDFIVIESIVTRSLAQPPRDPRFIFRKISSKSLSVFSYTYPNEKTFGTARCESFIRTEFQYVRGLIGFWSSHYGQFNIHNPTTNQSLSLPIEALSTFYYLFGYDPLENQYKVLRVSQGWALCQVFTLGDPKNKWRNIECSFRILNPYLPAVCINGTIYYKANRKKKRILASFDVRSEETNNLQAPGKLTAQFGQGYSSLVNYQGKLGCMCRNKLNTDVDLWVLEDAKKQEWSKITFPSMLQDIPSSSSIRFSDVIHPGGEIVIVRKEYLNQIPLRVYYYDPKRNSRRSVEIKTTMRTDSVQIWPVTDHVDNTLWL